MAFHNVLNNASSTLTGAIGTTDLTMSVAADVFPAVPFYLTLRSNPATSEIVEVTAKAGLTFTIVRAKDGTTAKTYAIGDSVQLFMVAGLLDEIKTEIGVTNAAAIALRAESASIVIIKKDISILTASWVNDTATSGFWYYEISDTDVTADSVVDVNVQLADLANAGDVKSVTQSFAGTYRLYADAQPTVNLTADVKITNSIGGVA